MIATTAPIATAPQAPAPRIPLRRGKTGMRTIRYLLLACLTFSASARDTADPPPAHTAPPPPPARTGRAAITGTVRSAQTARVLPGAQIMLQGAGQQAVSDSMGDYRLDSLEAGSYMLLVTLEGYEPQQRADIHLGPATTRRVDIDLALRLGRLDDVVVAAGRWLRPPDMGSSTRIVNRDELLRAPGALMDIQRIVQNLPSVSSGADNVNEVIVRGGMPGENLFVMDNIIIPNPNHFADQSSGGGVISLVNPLLVNSVTFVAGAPPAQYGGKASSVIDVQLRDGNDVMILGGVDAGVGGAGLHLEGPLWPGATFMASGTHSYLGFVSRFAPEAAVPRYRGAQVRVAHRANSSTWTWNGVLGDNSIHIRNAHKTANLPWEQIRAGGIVYAGGGTWERRISPLLSSTVTLSASGNTFERLTWTPAAADTGFINQSGEHQQRLDVRLRADGAGGRQVQGGVHLERVDFDVSLWEQPSALLRYTADTPDTVRDAQGRAVALAPPHTAADNSWLSGGYVSAIVPLFDRVRVVPGVRFDASALTRSRTVSPRLAMVLSLAPATDLTSAFGVQYQEPSWSELAASPANRSLRPRRVVTATAGLEHTWGALDVKTIAESFVKRYDHLTIDRARLEPWSGFAFLRSHERVDNGEALAYGLEFFAEKKLVEHLFFSAAWSWSQARTRFPGFAGGEWYPSDFDFGHVVTLNGGGKFELHDRPFYQRLSHNLLFRLASPLLPLADRTEISARFRYLGGRPYTPALYDEAYRRWRYAAPPNSSRHPPYHRLDLRWERRYAFGLVHLMYYIELQNLYARRNIWAQFYNDESGTVGTISQLPFFPAGGVIIGF